ncbi:MAG: fatty acid cis/trans isomerase, partial [Betaproteobacteria bacterium]
STLFREERALAPEENAVTVLRGFVGAYPNTLYRLRREDLPALASAIGALASEADYRRLADRFALRRTDPEFWRASDALQDAHAAWAGSAGGLLDYSRWENR